VLYESKGLRCLSVLLLMTQVFWIQTEIQVDLSPETGVKGKSDLLFGQEKNTPGPTFHGRGIASIQDAEECPGVTTLGSY
jgi:hypothetical protein